MGKSEEPRSSPVVNRPCRLCGDSCNGRFIGTIIAPRIIIADVGVTARVTVSIFKVRIGGAQHIMTDVGYIGTIIRVHIIIAVLI